MSFSTNKKKQNNIINCVTYFNNLSNSILRSKYNLIVSYYIHMALCFKYLLYFYRKFNWRNISKVTENNDLSYHSIFSFRKYQFDLFSVLYEKFNYFPIFYNIRRKRKQRRSLFVVLAFDRHVFFKNVEREYLQLKFIYSKCI